jgi:AcrR family transcriptional regulator
VAVKRSYNSPARQEQAARTRARIVDAAATLFERDGYARTTVTGIATAAEVAPDTVYATFGTKARVLTAVIDARLAPAGDANVMDRPEARAVRDEPDQRVQVARFTRDMMTVLQRVRRVYEILRTAAAVEPEVAAVHAEMDRYRLTNMRRVASWLAAHGPLRVDPERAAEILWGLASPDVARMYLDGLGWDEERFRAWLEDSIIRLLLMDPPP